MIATIRALNFWHNHFREDFRFNPEVIVKLREFEDLVKNDGLENFLKIDQTADDRWGRSNSLKTPQHHIIRRPSLGFDSIPPEELSEILGSLDYKLFRRIPFREFSIYAQTARLTEDTPRIEECIRLFNGLEYQEIIQFIWFISQA
jgi:16S rRNA C967 or C1407 C5-methylase (RsmB/RsmF family)